MVRIRFPSAESHQRTVPGVGFDGAGRPLFSPQFQSILQQADRFKAQFRFRRLR
jgi:hypothetical protein